MPPCELDKSSSHPHLVRKDYSALMSVEFKDYHAIPSVPRDATAEDIRMSGVNETALGLILDLLDEVEWLKQQTIPSPVALWLVRKHDGDTKTI